MNREDFICGFLAYICVMITYVVILLSKTVVNQEKMNKDKL
jgi:hypothetical protein